MNDRIECPECGGVVPVVESDLPVEYDESVSFKCSWCEKKFMLCFRTSYYISAYKAPCMNGAPHEYGRVPFEMDGEFKGCSGIIYHHFEVKTCKICGHKEMEWS